MHSRIFIVALAAALPIAAHAQIDASGATREQRVQLERTGYRPGRTNNPHDPDDVLAADAWIGAACIADPYAVSAAHNALFVHH